MLKLALLGASGRMGRAILGLLPDIPEFRLCGALASPASRWLTHDVGELSGGPATGVIITGDAATAVRDAATVVDFTLPAALPANLAACVANGLPIAVGTTGLDESARAAAHEAASRIPVLLAPNMSVGVNLLFGLVRVAGRALGQEYDAEIYEAHHRHKKDAPSGTALSLGEELAAARGSTLEEVAIWARHGSIGERPAGTIGFSVLRAGDIVGDHVVTFAGGGERLELAHRAHDRSTFARGALRAAAWLVGRPPGLYGMQDVLGLALPGRQT